MSDDAQMILHAANFAAQAHGTQKRKNAKGLPYITHPIGVANILAQHGASVPVLQASILHDVAEVRQERYACFHHALTIIVSGHVHNSQTDSRRVW